MMTYSYLDPAMQSRVAWNAGKTVGTKRPLTQKQMPESLPVRRRSHRYHDVPAMNPDPKKPSIRMLKPGDQAAHSLAMTG